MNPEPHLSHVAFLVPSVTQAATFTSRFGFHQNPLELFEGEGTREIYVGEFTKSALLLLMEPTRPGAYERAMRKRGPGLHHIAIDVPDIETYILQLASSGWLLHPQSVKTMKTAQTAYLARPGIPTLIEVQKDDSTPKPLFIASLEVPFPKEHATMLESLNVPELKLSPDHETWITCEKNRFSGKDLCR